jgi:hypothetical protein
MKTVTDEEFITAIFGEDAPWCHVTDFTHDPSNIPKDQSLFAWKGDYYSRYRFTPESNRYFTISTFYCDEQQQARRRKALYRQTHCVVLDDVREKLSHEAALLLPKPSWILETSPGSEQWGYILDVPCTVAARIDNLNDGLIESDLAPSGKDPGQKGITRYVRLPEGYNNKASKLVNGLPFKCQMLEWNPHLTVTLEQLAEPFSVNLDASRRDGRVDGAADIPDHPLVNIPDIIHVKEVRSNGRFDIVCPWVEDHTGAADDGSAIFTNDDGSIGFKCHHGSCEGRTGRDLLRYIDGRQPGFTESYSTWQLMRDFGKVAEVSFMEAPVIVEEPVSFMEAPVAVVVAPTLEDVFEVFEHCKPGSPEQREKATLLLKAVDSLPQIDKAEWHSRLCHHMRWTKPAFKEILKDLRETWYQEDKTNAFCDTVFFIKEQNQFYDWKSRIFFTPDAFQNSYSHLDPDAKKTALTDNLIIKVDRLDYAPKMPRTFTQEGRLFGNTWFEGESINGVEGDAQPWLDHFDTLGWGDNRDHMLRWMAYTIQHPEFKINHMLILGGYEGSGKDFLLYPLTKAMGHHYRVISGDELLSDFNEFAMGTKYLHINEAELGTRAEARAVSNQLKPYAAAPPETLSVNQKGIKSISVRNIVNTTMTTNSQIPVALNNASRRYYAVWSDLDVRDDNDNMTPEWKQFWAAMWPWMTGGGWQHVVWYLRNKVDISQFNPGEAPPMTDFLRDIQESSKSPMRQTLEACIKSRLGLFNRDLLTATEISGALRAADASHELGQLLCCEASLFTPTRVGIVLKEMPSTTQHRVNHGGFTYRITAMRNIGDYKKMGDFAMGAEYERQMKQQKATTGIRAVK